MDIKMISPKELIPYDRNPRHNDAAVDKVAASINEFGFRQPIVVDGRNTIIVGHTRLKAALKIGLSEVPVIVADNLTQEQVKAYRLADNKTGELSRWDFSLLDQELSGIDNICMDEFGFEGIDVVEYISTLLDDDDCMGSVSAERETFNLTLTFSSTYKEELNAYIKANGKSDLVIAILEKAGVIADGD